MPHPTCPNGTGKDHTVMVVDSKAAPDAEFPGKPTKVTVCSCGFRAEVYQDLVFSSHENRWRPK